MDPTEWGNVGANIPHYLSEELPRIYTMPIHVRMRSFFEGDGQSGEDAAGRVVHREDDFFVHKQRRFDRVYSGLDDMDLATRCRSCAADVPSSHDKTSHDQHDDEDDRHMNNDVHKERESTAVSSSMARGAASTGLRGHAPLTQPLLTVLHDPFAVARRRHATFQWLTAQEQQVQQQQHAPSGQSSHASCARSILTRFALDRRLGARPSLASVNKALRLLGQSAHRSQSVAAAMDLMEDELLESATLPASTVEAMVDAVSATHPVWAARLTFMQHDMRAVCGATHTSAASAAMCANEEGGVPAQQHQQQHQQQDGMNRIHESNRCIMSGHAAHAHAGMDRPHSDAAHDAARGASDVYALPLRVWQRLSAHLTRVSEQQTTRSPTHSRAHDRFLDVFERVLHRVRVMSTELSESYMIAFGRAMLHSGRPLTAVVRLVQEELLSGRNRDAGGRVAALQLSAFLSDLLVALCTAALAGGSETVRGGVPRSVLRRVTRATPSPLRGVYASHATAGEHPNDTTPAGSTEGSQVDHDVRPHNNDCAIDATMTGTAARTSRLHGHGQDAAARLCTDQRRRDATTSGANASLLVFAGDVVKYAFARKLQLTAHAFDLMLRLCDEEKAYWRLCVSYCVMCTLSTPTLTSFLRLVEVVESVPALVPRVTELLDNTPLGVFYLWNVRTFGSLLIPADVPERGVALQALCQCLGRCFAHNTSTMAHRGGGAKDTSKRHDTSRAGNHDKRHHSGCREVYMEHHEENDGLGYAMHMFHVLLEMSGPHYAGVFLATCMTARRELPPDERIGGRLGTLHSQLCALQSTDARSMSVLLQLWLPPNAHPARGDVRGKDASEDLTGRLCQLSSAACPDTTMRTSHHHDDDDDDHSRAPFPRCAASLDDAIRVLVPVSQRHCNILDASALNALASSAAAAYTFIRMMQNYARRDGATAVVPVELLCGDSTQLTPPARALVTTWRDGSQTSSWFALLPVSFCVQLDSATGADGGVSLCCELFHRVRHLGHRRVAVITADAQAAVRAREANVVPTILLSDLLSKLAQSTTTATSAASSLATTTQ